MRLALCQIDDQFTEQTIRPGEPTAGKRAWVVLMKCFVHEAGPGMGGFQPVQTALDLSVVVTTQRVMDDRHRPNSIAPRVWATHPNSGASLAEIRIPRAPGQVAGA